MVDAPAPPHSSPPAPTALPVWSRTWRILAVLTALGTLVVGQVHNTDDLFPFGSLAQYATAQRLDGAVRSVFMTGDFPARGDTAAVEGRRVSLNQRVVGVGRGEIEGQLQRFVDDPELLGVLARAYADLNPGAIEPDSLYLQRSIRVLKDGSPTGEETIEVIAQWHRN